MLFHEVLRRAAFRHPDKELLFSGDDSVTYGQADRQSDALAASYRDMGLASGDRIDVAMANSVEAVLVCLAAWKAGLLPVMIDPRAPDLEDYVAFASPSLLTCDADRPEFAAVKRRLTRQDIHGLCAKPVSGFDAVKDETLGTNLSFTSGTTGKPKGVVLPHGPQALTTACIAERMGLEVDDVILHPGPLYSSFHLVAMLLPGMHRGASMGLMETWDPAAAWDIIERCGVTVFTAYPMILADLVEYARKHGKRSQTLRLAMSGGSTTAAEIKRRYHRTLGIPLVESYGQSELGGFVALGDPRHDLEKRPMATGRPLPDKVVAILDREGRELPIGRYGEIALSGGCMTGYWEAPEQTAHALRNGWLHTGDIGRLDEDGFVYLLCRDGDQLDAGGRWFFPRELEEMLYEHPAVEHAAAFYRAGKLHAFVSLLASVTDDELQAFARSKLPPELQPASLTILDAMPRTGSGKLNKPALKARQP